MNALRWIWRGLLLLASHPVVRRMLWQWAQWLYKTIKNEIQKRRSEPRDRSLQRKRTASRVN